MSSPSRQRVLTTVLVLVVAMSVAANTDSAANRYKSLRTKLRETHKANDWAANRIYANQLKELLNAGPNSLLEVARADVRVGDLPAAFGELEQYTRMGQSAELIGSSADFAELRKDPQFAKIESALKENLRAVAEGSTAFQLPDPGLLAEDVDYDPETRRFFVTSVREKKIVSVEAGGAATDFANAPDHWPMLAVKVDRSRHFVWATEVAMQGMDLSPESDWGKSALLCYEMKSGKLRRRVDGPAGSALGDMTLTANGDVIVSDGYGGGVYRLAAKESALQRLDDGDFISPQTAAMHPDGRHVFVPDYVRGVGVLELATKQVRWLPMDGKFALNGIDGLYFDHGKLIGVQNGTSPERVVVFTLDATLTRIESEQILEQSTDTLGDPTHGVVIGQQFYYITNSGWDLLDERGNMQAGAKPTAPRIMRANL
jgi:sugar lactone lactonase YvrE